MGPQLHLSVTVCNDADEAVVVRKGTVGGNSTVDLVLKDESGQKFVVMLTGALVKSIPC